MIKAHLITAATALSLGISGTLAVNGITEVNAAVSTKTASACMRDVPNDNAVLVAIMTRVSQSLCPKLESEAGANEGDCVFGAGTEVSISKKVDTTTVCASHPFPVTIVYGAPQ